MSRGVIERADPEQFNQLLVETGMTLGDVAKAFGFGLQTVKNWHRSPPLYVVNYLDMRLRVLKMQRIIKEMKEKYERKNENHE